MKLLRFLLLDVSLCVRVGLLFFVMLSVYVRFY